LKNRIEAIRKERGLRQGELASALDVSRQTISSLENGRYSPSIPLAFKIARYFDMSIEEIFIFENEAISGASSYLNYKGYVGNIKFIKDDAVFRGKVVGISTLLEFEGTSVLTITEGFQNVIDEYLRMCVEKNKEPEKSFRGSFNVCIDAALHRKAVLEASKRGISLDKFIEKLILNA
jgi:putative transcriptional regulator